MKFGGGSMGALNIWTQNALKEQMAKRQMDAEIDAKIKAARAQAELEKELNPDNKLSSAAQFFKSNPYLAMQYPEQAGKAFGIDLTTPKGQAAPEGYTLDPTGKPVKNWKETTPYQQGTLDIREQGLAQREAIANQVAGLRAQGLDLQAQSLQNKLDEQIRKAQKDQANTELKLAQRAKADHSAAVQALNYLKAQQTYKDAEENGPGGRKAQREAWYAVNGVRLLRKGQEDPVIAWQKKWAGQGVSPTTPLSGTRPPPLPEIKAPSKKTGLTVTYKYKGTTYQETGKDAAYVASLRKRAGVSNVSAK